MFDHKHYVPILKTKAGEAWALFNLDGKLREQMTPVLEIHKPKKEKDKPAMPLVEHIHAVCERIKDNWGTAYPFFLDTEWVNSQHGTTSYLSGGLRGRSGGGWRGVCLGLRHKKTPAESDQGADGG